MVGCIKIRNLFSLFAGSKKYTRDVSKVTTMFSGSKKCTREGVGCSLSLRVQKNAPAIVLNVVILSGAKDLAGCTNILWFGDLEILHFVQNDSA